MLRRQDTAWPGNAVMAPLVLACGALASELRAVLGQLGAATSRSATSRPTSTTGPSASSPR